jgi:hypothetical protein
MVTLLTPEIVGRADVPYHIRNPAATALYVPARLDF